MISAGNGRNVVFVTLFTLRLLATSAPEAHVYLHRIHHYNSQCCSHSPPIPHLIAYIPSNDFVGVMDAAKLTLSFAYIFDPDLAHGHGITECRYSKPLKTRCH